MLPLKKSPKLTFYTIIITSLYTSSCHSMDIEWGDLAGISRDVSPAVGYPLEDLMSTNPEDILPLLASATGIIMAVRHNDPEKVSVVLDTGADVNTQDPRGKTALHYAVEKNNHSIISLLLARRAAVNVQGYPIRDTPLHIAAVAANPLTIQMLLAAGADPTIQNEDFETPLHLITCKGTKQTTLMLLAAHADPQQMDYLGRIPLHRAALHGNLEVFKTLIEAGTNRDIHKQDIYGKTPLHLASTPEITTALLYLGAEIDQQDKQGKTALHEAADSSNIAKALVLIKHGADQKIEDCHHDWPINIVIPHDNDCVVNIFCEGLRIQREKEHNLASILALATHDRLGAQSPFSLLPSFLLSKITREAVLAGIRSNIPSQKTVKYLDPDYNPCRCLWSCIML